MILDAIGQAVNAANSKQIEPCDYYGEDGLLYCGKCGTPKECRPIHGAAFGIEKVRCLCKCEDERQKAEARRLSRQARMDEIRSEAFTNARMYEYTFAVDDGTNTMLSTVARNYVEKFDTFKAMHKGLLFYGGVGTGKSFAAACIVNALTDKGIRARFTNFSEIESERRENEDAIRRLNRYDLLVLDDFATERDTSYMNEIVFAVIDARIQSGLPMVVTTNLTADELKKCVDPDKAKVISRLLGACEPIEVKGEDRRRKQLRTDHADVKKLLGI